MGGGEEGGGRGGGGGGGGGERVRERFWGGGWIELSLVGEVIREVKNRQRVPSEVNQWVLFLAIVRLISLPIYPINSRCVVLLFLRVIDDLSPPPSPNSPGIVFCAFSDLSSKSLFFDAVLRLIWFLFFPALFIVGQGELHPRRTLLLALCTVGGRREKGQRVDLR